MLHWQRLPWSKEHSPIQITMKYLYYFSIFFLFLSCNRTPYPADIEAVLDSAGKNRKQLELVLEHYSQHKKDSLKLQAAEYLIRYMPGKCTETYEAQWEDIASALYRWENVKDKERLMQKQGEKKVYEDIHCITAQYLINNIELAFRVWQEQPWGKHIPFDTFCEEILPYRVGKEPLEDWRGKVLAAFDDQLTYFKEHPEISAVEACCRINRLLPPFAWVSYPVPAMNYSMLMSTSRGTCDEMGALAVFVMRALGIPVSQDFTLQWPNRTVGHSWNTVCDSTGRHISFMGTEANPGETHLGTRLAKSKVYRTMYAKQNVGEKGRANLPEELANPYMKDVSNEYTNCTYCVDIPKLPAIQTDTIHTVYLLSFGKEVSCIVDKGELIAEKIRFTHIGNRVTYLPVSLSDGHYTAIGYPFRIDKSGILHIFSTDPKNRQTVSITDIGLNQSMLYRMQEGVFEGANQADFADKKTLGGLFHTVNDIERISDHSMNFGGHAVTLAKHGLVFSKETCAALTEMRDQCKVALGQLQNFGDRDLLEKIRQYEELNDKTVRAERKRQIREEGKLEDGAERIVVCSEVLADYERIGDHMLNIAQALTDHQEVPPAVDTTDVAHQC